MLSHALTPYQTVFLAMMKNVVGVYASTLEYLKQCDVIDENILGSLRKETTVEDQNRLLFFENEYKDVDENEKRHKKEAKNDNNQEETTSSPEKAENFEEMLLFDLTEDLTTSKEEPKNDLSDLLDTNAFSFWNKNVPPETKQQPMTETAKKNQDWFNIFAELDPLANHNGTFNLQQNSEAT